MVADFNDFLVELYEEDSQCVRVVQMVCKPLILSWAKLCFRCIGVKKLAKILGGPWPDLAPTELRP
jgi:hypothetical protein